MTDNTDKTGIITKIGNLLTILKTLDWRVVLILCITLCVLFGIYSFSNIEQSKQVGESVELLNQNTEILKSNTELLNNSMKSLSDRLETYDKSITARLDGHDQAIDKLIECFNEIINKKENEIETDN